MASHHSSATRVPNATMRTTGTRPRRPAKQDRLPCYDCCDADDVAD